ncbi:MAG: type IV pilus modification PilV family protein [Planctomycetota bacterium]
MGWMNRRPAGRAGLTLVEVLIALAVFLVGSVSIIGLFVTASALHKDAVQRRTASYIGESLLAQTRGAPFRWHFASTRLDQGVDPTDGSISVESTTPGAENPAASFDKWPIWVGDEDRGAGPILIDSEWMWYDDTGPTSFSTVARGLWGTDRAEHYDGARVLQPRAWAFVLEEDLPATEETSLEARGPSEPPPPLTPGDSGYILLDEEWIRYTNVEQNESLWTFAWDDSERDRGAGHTVATAHQPGTPIALAWPHPDYPGYYFTVQIYPTNARGVQAKVIVSVAYGTASRLRRAHFFHTVYTPSRF